MNPFSSSSVPSKRVNLIEDEIHVAYFMDKFQSHIYKYIKHLHRYRWKSSEFKLSHEVFDPRTILLVVYFVENYTFSPSREIQGEYYHAN